MSREQLESRARDCLLDEAEESQLSERSVRPNRTVALSSLLKKSQFMEGWFDYAPLFDEKEINISSERLLKVSQRNGSSIAKREIIRKSLPQISIINHTTPFSLQIEPKQQKIVQGEKQNSNYQQQQKPKLRILQPQLSNQIVQLSYEAKSSSKQQPRGMKQSLNNSSKERYPSVESLIHARLQMQSQQINLKLIQQRKTQRNQIASHSNYSPEMSEIGLSKKQSTRNQSSKIVGLFSLSQQRKRSTSQLAPQQISLSHNSSINSSNFKNTRYIENISSSLNESALQSYLQDYAKPEVISLRDSYQYSDDQETNRPLTSKTSSRTYLSAQSNRQNIRSSSPTKMLYRQQNNYKEVNLSTRPQQSETDDISFHSMKKIAIPQQQKDMQFQIKTYFPLPQVIHQIQAEKKSIGISRLDEVYSSIQRQVKQHKQIITSMQQDQFIKDKNAIEQFKIQRNQTYSLWS